MYAGKQKLNDSRQQPLLVRINSIKCSSTRAESLNGKHKTLVGTSFELHNYCWTTDRLGNSRITAHTRGPIAISDNTSLLSPILSLTSTE